MFFFLLGIENQAVKAVSFRILTESRHRSRYNMSSWDQQNYTLISNQGLLVWHNGQYIAARLFQHNTNSTLRLFYNNAYCNCRFRIEESTSTSSSSSSSNASSAFNGINRQLEDRGGNLMNTAFSNKRDGPEDKTENMAKRQRLDDSVNHSFTNGNEIINQSMEVDNDDVVVVGKTLTVAEYREIMFSLQTTEFEDVVDASCAGCLHPSFKKADSAFAAVKLPNYEMSYVEYMKCKQISCKSKECRLFLMTKWFVNLMDDNTIKKEIDRIIMANDGKLPPL